MCLCSTNEKNPAFSRAWQNRNAQPFTDTYAFKMPFKKKKKKGSEKLIKRKSLVTDVLHYLTVSMSATPNVHYPEGSVSVFGRHREESMMLINSLPFSVCAPNPPTPPANTHTIFSSLFPSSTTLPQLHMEKANNFGRCKELEETG